MSKRGPLLVVSAAILFDALDLSITQVALPSIQADLGVSAATLQWVPNAYVLTHGAGALRPLDPPVRVRRARGQNSAGGGVERLPSPTFRKHRVLGERASHRRAPPRRTGRRPRHCRQSSTGAPP
jgi:hypothetical protein